MAREPGYLTTLRRLQGAKEQSAAEQELFDRELFYAIQPPPRLAQLIERTRRDVGVGP